MTRFLTNRKQAVTKIGQITLLRWE